MRQRSLVRKFCMENAPLLGSNFPIPLHTCFAGSVVWQIPSPRLHVAGGWGPPARQTASWSQKLGFPHISIFQCCKVEKMYAQIQTKITHMICKSILPKLDHTSDGKIAHEFRFYRRLVRHVLKQAQWLPFDIADLEVSKGKYNMQIIILWYVIAMGNCHACDC